MITYETVRASHASLTEEMKGDDAVIMKMISAFCAEEPHFSAFIHVLLGSGHISNPILAGLMALCSYRRMLESQSESDQLKRDLGGPTQEE